MVLRTGLGTGWAISALLSLCYAVFIACLLLPVCANAEKRLELSIENEEGHVLYSAPVENGAVFGIRYLHSVALSPVTDYFIIKKNSIWLDRTVYEDFGAGLPHAPEGRQVMRSHNGKLSISGYDRELGTFQLRVGRVANHILLLMPGEKRKSAGGSWLEIPLDSIAEPGSAITFAVRSATF